MQKKFSGIIPLRLRTADFYANNFPTRAAVAQRVEQVDW